MAAKFTYLRTSAGERGWQCGYFEGPSADWNVRGDELTYDEALNMTNDLNHHLDLQREAGKEVSADNLRA